MVMPVPILWGIPNFGRTQQHPLLKEEIFEEIGSIDDDEDKHSGQVDSQDGVQDPSLQDDRHLDASVHIAGVGVSQGPVGDQILSEHQLGFHGDDVRGDLHHQRLQLPHNQAHGAHLDDPH